MVFYEGMKPFQSLNPDGLLMLFEKYEKDAESVVF